MIMGARRWNPKYVSYCINLLIKQHICEIKSDKYKYTYTQYTLLLFIIQM